MAYRNSDKPRPPRGPSRIERVEKTLITFIDEQRKFNQTIIKRLDSIEIAQKTQGNLLKSVIEINKLKTE